MEAKEFWKSKTLIFNVFLPVLFAVVDAWVNGQDVRQIVAIGMATLAAVLRSFTSTGVVYKLKSGRGGNDK